MKFIRDILQPVGKFADLRLQLSTFVSSIHILPAVIQHDMVITEISQTQSNNLVRGSQEKLLGNVATKCIPVVLQT